MASDRVIWKFQMQSSRQVISMPAGAEIVAVHEQHGALTFWASCHPEATDQEERVFRQVATGETYPAGLAYRGTALFASGTFVFHLMEEV